jgi:hypothetical protein
VGQPAEKGIHAYLDDLCQQEVYGSITIRFHKGAITAVSDGLEWRLQDLKDCYGDAPERIRRVLVVRKGSKPDSHPGLPGEVLSIK